MAGFGASAGQPCQAVASAAAESPAPLEVVLSALRTASTGNATRKPMRMLRYVESRARRCEARQPNASISQAPPRSTRREPAEVEPLGSIAGFFWNWL